MNREVYYDQLRALAIIGIVCCHVFCDIALSLNPAIMGHFKSFYILSFFSFGNYMGIPIFVMLSGALLINKHYSLSEFVKKRFNRVFVPFLFWVVIYVLFAVFVRHQDLTLDLVTGIAFGCKGSIGVILWFIWMIMIVYVGIFVIDKILDYGKSRWEGFDRRFINILTALSLIVYILLNFGYIKFSGSFQYYLFFIPFAVIGYYLTHTEFTETKLAEKLNITPDRIVVTTLILSVAFYLYFIYSVCMASIAANKVIAGTYFQFLAMIFTFSLILLFRYLPKCSSNFAGKISSKLSSGPIGNSILSISMCSFGIYFIHYLIFKFIQVQYLYPVRYYDHPMFWQPIVLVIVFFSSWFIIWIISKIPVVNRISGAN